MADKHTPEMYREHRQRLRAEMLKNGAGSFTDYKLLELFLFDSLPRVDTYPTAHRLLEKFRSCGRIFSATREELLKVKGVGPVTAARIAMIGEIINRSVIETMTRRPIDNAEKASSVLLWLMRDSETDSMMIIFVDSDYKYIYHKALPRGTSSEVIAASVLAERSDEEKGLIFAHRHPGKCMKPTPADIGMTEYLSDLCADNGMTLLEHFIVTDNDAVGILAMHGKAVLKNEK